MTARAVASRRAAHQLLDLPLVLPDPLAVPILGPEFFCNPARHADPRSRAFRAWIVARSRHAEDTLASAVAAGVTQYLILGAGLDTFAYRNPYPHLHVFEADLPSMQQWKQQMLLAASIPTPASVTRVPLDLEHQTLAAALAHAGFDAARPAFITWLGVTTYLTLAAFRATLQLAASLPPTSGITLDYSLDEAELTPQLQRDRRSLAARVAAAGEPFQLFFTTAQMQAELRAAGFHRTEQLGNADLNHRYFANRTDNLALPPEGLAKIATAWL